MAFSSIMFLVVNYWIFLAKLRIMYAELGELFGAILDLYISFFPTNFLTKILSGKIIHGAADSNVFAEAFLKFTSSFKKLRTFKLFLLWNIKFGVINYDKQLILIGSSILLFPSVFFLIFFEINLQPKIIGHFYHHDEKQKCNNVEAEVKIFLRLFIFGLQFFIMVCKWIFLLLHLLIIILLCKLLKFRVLWHFVGIFTKLGLHLFYSLIFII